MSVRGSRRSAAAIAAIVALALGAAPAALRADRARVPEPFGSFRLAAADSIAYRSAVMGGNLVGVTITNYGFVGNNFINRTASLEYPLGAGYEHLVRGGLWIGAIARDDVGEFTGVVHAAVDGSQGSASQGASEFTPANDSILVASKLEGNDNYSPDAVSELDFYSVYSDFPPKRADNSGEDHRPVGLLVKQSNYSWSFSQYQNVNFIHYEIINTGPPLKDVWVGFYSEFASGSKKDQATWPPSGWYNKKWIDVDDDITLPDGDTTRVIPPLFREHYCRSLPIPDGCDLQVAPYWIGVKLLGWTGSAADTVVNKRVSLSAWGYSPFNSLRNEDVERYALMNTGVIQSLEGDSLQPGGDPVAVLSVGPFSQIDPGDTISVDFALVGGAEIADIREHSQFAQRAFDRNYVIPVPPPPPRMHVSTRRGGLDVFWDDRPEFATDPTSPIPQDFEGYRVYLGDDPLDLRLVAQFDKETAPNDTTGFNTGFGAVRHDTTIAGHPYRYRYAIDHLRDGFKYYVAVTAYDLGNVETEPLEAGISRNNKFLAIAGPAAGEQVADDRITVFPNPYRVEAGWDQGTLVRDHYLWFANLPQRATIRIYTLAGDLVFETPFDGAAYDGSNARGVYDPATDRDINDIRLSGRSWAWNMITREGQAAATGLYIYSIEDRDSGKRTVGKFLIVKSDREGF